LRFYEKGWKEVFVSLVDGELRESEGPLSIPDVVAELGLDKMEWLERQELEVRPSIPAIYREWGTLLSRGYVITLDYGHPRPFLYSPVRSKGTWMCYHGHESNQKILENIGRQDITAHVDFSQLAEAGRKEGFDPALFCSQGIFLAHLGSERIEKFLNEDGPPSRARAGAVQQLVHPDAMGEAFWTLVQAKGVPLPAPLAALPNRLRRL
jgi:SAM-dependent MidA family methyltransferase